MNFDQLNQQQYETAIIMGVTKFKGEIEGSNVDTWTVFKATPFKAESGNAVGIGLAKLRFGDSSNFEMFKNLKFPMEMELLIGRTTNSSGKETAVVKDVRFQVLQLKFGRKCLNL